MGTTPQDTTRVTTGLLSKSEREFFRGDNKVEDPDGYRRNARYRARKRIDQVEDDVKLLREVGEEDLVEEFLNRFRRTRELERRIEELEAELEEG